MGHSKGRDNAKKRAKRRKKTERLALAKKKQAAAKYYAARNCAPAPNTLAAALLPSSFRNKDFASFFCCSDTLAWSIAMSTFSSASVIACCCGVPPAIDGCSRLETRARRLLSIEIETGDSTPPWSTSTPEWFIFAKPDSWPIPLLSSTGVQSIRPYSESWATARNQSRRFIPPGGGTTCSPWPNGREPSLRRS